MKNIVLRIVQAFARLVLLRHKPTIIAITGSVGKTSAKYAIAHIVSQHYRCRMAQGSYNNELGVPLTILGARSPGKNIAGWILVGIKACLALTLPRSHYPAVLVLELGADKPGDISALMQLAPPHIGVLTAVRKVHYEFFKSLSAIQREKHMIVRLLRADGHAVINADDELVLEVRNTCPVPLATYGTVHAADVQAYRINVEKRDGIIGLAMQVRSKGETADIFLPNVVLRAHAYAVLAGIAVAELMGITLRQGELRWRSLKLPAGRARMIEGMSGSCILDDTYNASPSSALAALETMKELRRHYAGRQIAVFGDMLELGAYSEQGHQEVGEHAARQAVDAVVTVGSLARGIAQGALSAGMPPAAVHAFQSQNEALAFLKTVVHEGDVLLVKGSQGARMERVVAALMRYPETSKALLVRHNKRWLRKV